MAIDRATQSKPVEASDRRRRSRGPLTFVIAFGTIGLLLFLPAGRLDWPAAWLWLGSIFSGAILVSRHVRRRIPDLAERRIRVGAGTAKWDLALVPLLRVSFVGLLVVSALDRGRYGWSSLGALGWMAGVFMLGVALIGLAWSMGANAYFETTVRIQAERNHQVVDRGPYRFIRHPGYLFLTLLWTGSALMLGSVWALIPAVIGVSLLVLRTSLEDRFLGQRLEGYRDYADRVRYRLVPFVW